MRFVLLVTKERRTIDTFEIDGDGATVIIGRGEDCDVRLESTSVSRSHCELFLRGGGQVVRDLSSSNGTFVNGERVRERALNDGDVLTVGEFTVRYTTGAPVITAVEPTLDDGIDLTMRVTPTRAPVTTESRPAVPRPVAHLRRAGEERATLIKRGAFIIGASPRADLKLDDGPPCGAAILRDGDGFVAVDLSPRRDALRVDGAAVPHADLKDGVELQVGSWRARFGLGLPRFEGAGRRPART